jgi:hypothetical protein
MSTGFLSQIRSVSKKALESLSSSPLPQGEIKDNNNKIIRLFPTGYTPKNRKTK